MTFGTLKLQKDEHITTICLNRPHKLNTLNEQLFTELEAALDQVAGDTETRVLVLAGDVSTFGAGADIQMIATNAVNAVQAHHFFQKRANPVYDKLSRLEIPTLAAISGLALGGVLELALACDLRVASETATFAMPEVNLGLMPGGGATQRLPRLIGATKALEMLLFGDFIDAKEAYRVGLVNKVVPPNRLMDEVQHMASKLAEKPTYALKMLKNAVMNGLELPLTSALEYERRCFEILFSTRNAREGMEAFIEKRKPRFEQE
jgi:enoyl-CoA hydratase